MTEIKISCETFQEKQRKQDEGYEIVLEGREKRV